MSAESRGVDIAQALETAKRAARLGGEVARDRLGDPGYLKWKGHRDVVSEGSLKVQEAIVSALLDEYPDSGILAEEGPQEDPIPVDASQLWIVDPICGSLNFVQGIPYFAISIALRSEGQICLGVVYDPCREEMFQASSQTPVTVNGRRIVIQQISDGSDAWESAMVGTDWPCGGERRERTKLILGLMADQVNGCQLMGSPSLGLCSVAAGRLHAYWHLDLKIWDIAAASLIVQRAGGILTDLEGTSWLYSTGGYVASNEVVHNRTIECIRAVSSFAGEG